MNQILSTIELQLPDSIYTKDPLSSDLGRRILQHSVEMIDEQGFEEFTFKKLGAAIGSNESSIYRYFSNKHTLLVYLSCWYWAWIDCIIAFEMHNLTDTSTMLQKLVDVLTETSGQTHQFFDTIRLRRIMVNENAKAYMTKEVDEENKRGYFLTYKNLIQRIAGIFSQADPEYPYPMSLACLILDSALHQTFIVEHFHSISEGHDSQHVNLLLSRILSDSLNN